MCSRCLSLSRVAQLFGTRGALALPVGLLSAIQTIVSWLCSAAHKCIHALLALHSLREAAVWERGSYSQCSSSSEVCVRTLNLHSLPTTRFSLAGAAASL